MHVKTPSKKRERAVNKKGDESLRSQEECPGSKSFRITWRYLSGNETKVRDPNFFPSIQKHEKGGRALRSLLQGLELTSTWLALTYRRLCTRLSEQIHAWMAQAVQSSGRTLLGSMVRRDHRE
ncbi:hypothetical protein ARMSODRAFT_960608 [Armillaria solidipes]|uniref:Uncharacterized protein n=1 Tax=Armillaria solidipes TaxID=1076256 RepID=A0A2H3BB72_9AGAR|nr:hypothetical protein ARMSODRAFT_960608 [Armillaria solidipes]